MKKTLAALLALCLALCLSACAAPQEDTTLVVGASPAPHAEILEFVKPMLAEQGIDLQIEEFTDYVLPNQALESGDLDANYFQHLPYLLNYNESTGATLVSAGSIHFEPLGIYAGKSQDLSSIPDGAVIAVPNDATNEARALQLLAAQGLIELKEDAGLNATPNDITSNPKNLQFKELEAAMLPQTASEVDLSVINSNFAMEGGMNPATDSLASEDADSEAAQTFANIIAVKEGHENDPAIQALVKALQSDKVKEYIEKTYSGAVVAVF